MGNNNNNNINNNNNNSSNNNVNNNNNNNSSNNNNNNNNSNNNDNNNGVDMNTTTTQLLTRQLFRMSGIFSSNSFSTSWSCAGKKGKQAEPKKPFISKKPQKKNKDKLPVQLQLNTSENPPYQET